MKVLVAQDKPRTADSLSRALHGEGHSVVVAHDGEQALEYGRSPDCDVILLDVMLPRLDGFTVIKTLRAEKHFTPTIIVSARHAMSDIVRGLDLGADDYLTTPYAFDVLLARMRAVARRGAADTPVELRFEDLSIDSATRELRRGNRVRSLTRTEFALLELLLRRAECIVPHDVLFEAGWGLGAEATEATLYVFVRTLRIKIGEPQLLHTARGVGYTIRHALG